MEEIDQKVMQGLQTMIRESALSRIGVHSRMDNFAIRELGDDCPVYGHWMTMILFASPMIRVIFKVHFMASSARLMASRLFRLPPSEINLRRGIDFMKEFCNLTLGNLGQQLNSKGIRGGISLPLVTRGFDEIFFPSSDSVRVFRDAWELFNPESALRCSCMFEILDPGIVKYLESKNESAGANEGIEFFA